MNQNSPPPDRGGRMGFGVALLDQPVSQAAGIDRGSGACVFGENLQSFAADLEFIALA
jgi:hypothetical protein